MSTTYFSTFTFSIPLLRQGPGAERHFLHVLTRLAVRQRSASKISQIRSLGTVEAHMSLARFVFVLRRFREILVFDGIGGDIFCWNKEFKVSYLDANATPYLPFSVLSDLLSFSSFCSTASAFLRGDFLRSLVSLLSLSEMDISGFTRVALLGLGLGLAGSPKIFVYNQTVRLLRIAASAETRILTCIFLKNIVSDIIRMNTGWFKVELPVHVLRFRPSGRRSFASFDGSIGVSEIGLVLG